MFASSLKLLALAPSMLNVEAFSPSTTHHHVVPICSRVSKHNYRPHQSRFHARGDGFADDGDEDDDRDFVYAGRRSGRRGREEGGYSDDRQPTGSSGRYQDNVEFFDLDDDDLFDDDYDEKNDAYEETYNGIIPNPLLDAMDPDGVYERLGPELFSDPIFYRDVALFAIVLALFNGNSNHYGTFDSVVEGLNKLPADFIK